MPQVFFNTDTFRPDQFPEPNEILLNKISCLVCECSPEIGRKISKKYLLHRVPNFWEAFRDGFVGWHLHHIAGESIDMKTMRKSHLYEGRPWWELRFMKNGDHRRIHGDPDIFYCKFYGLDK